MPISKPPYMGPPIGLPPIGPDQPVGPKPPYFGLPTGELPPIGNDPIGPEYPEGKSGMRPGNMEDFPTFIDGPPGGGQMHPGIPGQGPPGSSMGRNFGRFSKVSSQPQNAAEILRRAAAKRLEMG